MSAGTLAHHRRGVGLCTICPRRKVCYKTRADARAAARVLHPGEKMHAYPCGETYHFGHDELWREIPHEDLFYTPLPPLAVKQIYAMATLIIGVAA